MASGSRRHYPRCTELVVVACTLSCAGPAEIPPTPDLSPLESEYDTPSARLQDSPRVQSVLDSAPDVEQLAASFRSAGALLDDVDTASETADRRTGDGIRLRGALQLGVRCPGHDEDPVYDAAVNGSVSFTLAVSDNAIRRSFSGSAAQCKLRAFVRGTPLRVVLDGDVAFDLGSDLRLGTRWDRTRVLVSVQGRVEVEGFAFSGVSARFTSERFEYLYSVNDGTVILLFTQRGVGLQDAEGTWYCQFGSDACSLD